MIVVMTHQANSAEIEEVVDRLKGFGLNVHISQGVERTIIGVIGDKTRLREMSLESLPGVEKTVPILEPYKLASRSFKQENTTIRVRDIVIGGNELHVMAGPCAVESKDQLLAAAQSVQKAGATILRGGAFKPRTSPYSFQGMEEEGLKLLAETRELTGLPFVTEVMDTSTLPLVAKYADILQIGARNMQNFFLLREVAQTDKPILLKRSPSATVEEWLLAAEYILAGGNSNVILCERGIRTFENYVRNTLDLTVVPVLKHLTHLPVIVDPSHAIGKWRFVAPMARAAIAAGADGLLIEVHPDPTQALCDGPQSLTPENFKLTMNDIIKTAASVGRTIGCEN